MKKGEIITEDYYNRATWERFSQGVRMKHIIKYRITPYSFKCIGSRLSMVFFQYAKPRMYIRLTKEIKVMDLKISKENIDFFSRFVNIENGKSCGKKIR